MRTFEVTLPVTGIVYMTVQANSADEAIDKAMDEVKPEDLETWQTHRAICNGNVCHAEINEASAEECK